MSENKKSKFVGFLYLLAATAIGGIIVYQYTKKPSSFSIEKEYCESIELNDSDDNSYIFKCTAIIANLTENSGNSDARKETLTCTLGKGYFLLQQPSVEYLHFNQTEEQSTNFAVKDKSATSKISLLQKQKMEVTFEVRGKENEASILNFNCISS